MENPLDTILTYVRTRKNLLGNILDADQKVRLGSASGDPLIHQLYGSYKELGELEAFITTMTPTVWHPPTEDDKKKKSATTKQRYFISWLRTICAPCMSMENEQRLNMSFRDCFEEMKEQKL